MIKLKVYSLLENLMTCAWKSKIADSSTTTRLMSHDSCLSPAGNLPAEITLETLEKGVKYVQS